MDKDTSLDNALKNWTSGKAKNVFDFHRLTRPEYYLHFDPSREDEKDCELIEHIKSWATTKYTDMSDIEIHEASINGFLSFKEMYCGDVSTK